MTYIFTFGYGMPLERKAVQITAPSYESARQEMVRNFGTEWAFQYEETRYYELIKENGLEPYPIVSELVAE